MSAYIVAGPTVAVTATATSSGSSITPANANFGVDGANGPTVLKVVNTSASEPVFFKTATTAPTAVTAVDNCIAPGATDFIQVSVPGQPAVEIFFAAVAASSTLVYVTPVTLV